MSLDFHPEVEARPAADGAGWLSSDAKAVLRLQTFDAAATVQSAGQSIKDHNGQAYVLYDWKVERAGVSSWQNAVAMSWVSSGTPPIVRARVDASAGTWAFDIDQGRLKYTLDVRNRTFTPR